MMNKKGSTFQGWIIGISFIVIVLFMYLIIYTDMNAENNKNYDSTFGTGIQSQANDSYYRLIELQQSMQTATQNGTASFSTLGFLTLSTTWQLLSTTMLLISNVITGNWILQAVTLVKLPPVYGFILQAIYLLTLGYILLKIIFRIKT